MLECIPEILDWGNASAFHASLLAAHRTSLLDEYQERIALFLKAGIGARAARLTRELPDSSVDRILAAPETVNKLLFEPRTHFSHFLNALVAEHRLLGNPVDPEESVWTALFDYHFPSIQNGTSRASLETMAAPRLSNGTFLDISSPQAEQTYFPISSPSLPLTNEEAVRAGASRAGARGDRSRQSPGRRTLPEVCEDLSYTQGCRWAGADNLFLRPLHGKDGAAEHTRPGNHTGPNHGRTRPRGDSLLPLYARGGTAILSERRGRQQARVGLTMERPVAAPPYVSARLLCMVRIVAFLENRRKQRIRTVARCACDVGPGPFRLFQAGDAGSYPRPSASSHGTRAARLATDQ